MTESKTKPYAPRVISEGDIPVHKSLGEVAQTRNVGVDAGHCDSGPRGERRG
ncbi:hypothetical protein LRB91_07795 [Leclercia adecarboxylata]|nr:hypothetical protein [Leclercia adecarboxylata]MCZ7838732.1 hypothetical protein [Leclercia adecarboxylata]